VEGRRWGVVPDRGRQGTSRLRVLLQARIQPPRGDFFCGLLCRMDLPRPTTSVGTRTDYWVGPWDYLAFATRHLMAWRARTTVEEYSNRKLYMSCTV
jgi:hypothetical protein